MVQWWTARDLGRTLLCEYSPGLLTQEKMVLLPSYYLEKESPSFARIPREAPNAMPSPYQPVFPPKMNLFLCPKNSTYSYTTEPRYRYPLRLERQRSSLPNHRLELIHHIPLHFSAPSSRHGSLLLLLHLGNPLFSGQAAH